VLDSRLPFRNSLSLIEGCIGIVIVLQLQRDSRQRHNQLTHPRLLFQPNIDPTALPFLHRPIKRHSLPELARLCGQQMMMTLNRIHQPRILQIRMQLEQMFPQILWSLEILQVPGHILRRVEGLAFGHVGVVLEHDDLVDLEDGGDPGHLGDEVGAELGGLRQLEDRVGQGDGQVFQLYLLFGGLLLLGVLLRLLLLLLLPVVLMLMLMVLLLLLLSPISNVVLLITLLLPLLINSMIPLP